MGSEWHGWRVDHETNLYVGPLPGRKSIPLYYVDGSVLDVLAYFRNEDAAKKALQLIDRLAGISNE